MKPDFEAIRRVCHGMMRAEVYQAVYEAAVRSPGDVFLEVGAGHGAATVCLALAMRSRGRSGVVYSFDKFEGGSRKAYGDASQNLAAMHASLEHFGVDDLVRVVPGDVSTTAEAVPAEAPIALLMLDCDGRIDRDLGVFLDRVVPGGAVIIDDCADRVRATPKPGGVRIDQKHRLTWLLANSAEHHGLIQRREVVNQTWFGSATGRRVANWPAEAVLDCYRQLVFATAETPRD